MSLSITSGTFAPINPFAMPQRIWQELNSWLKLGKDAFVIQNSDTGELYTLPRGPELDTVITQCGDHVLLQYVAAQWFTDNKYPTVEGIGHA